LGQFEEDARRCESHVVQSTAGEDSGMFEQQLGQTNPDETKQQRVPLLRGLLVFVRETRATFIHISR